MAMEGINWGEVNSQGVSIIMSLFSLGANVIRQYQDFVDEMSYYWASGNAKIFGGYMQDDMKYFNDKIENTREEVALLIENAAEIYSRTFHVDNQISVRVGTTAASPTGDIITNPFHEILRGITGMNKNAVDECYQKLKTNVENYLEVTKTKIENVELSIFDAANAQKIAFEEKLSQLYSAIESYLVNAFQKIEKYKGEEQDRVTLAKQQTVNTFSA